MHVSRIAFQVSNLHIPAFLLDVIRNALHLRRREAGGSGSDDSVPDFFRIEHQHIGSGMPSDLPARQGQDRLHVDRFSERAAQFLGKRGGASARLSNGFAPDCAWETKGSPIRDGFIFFKVPASAAFPESLGFYGIDTRGSNDNVADIPIPGGGKIMKDMATVSMSWLTSSPTARSPRRLRA